MSVHGSEEDVNLVTNAGRQQQPSNSLNGLKESVKQNLFGDKDSEECHNLINSDNSGSECSSPKERARGEKSPKDTVNVSTFNGGEIENSQDIETRNSDAQIMETTQRLVHSNDQKLTDNDTRVHSANGDSQFTNEYHSETPQTTSHCPSTSQDCKRTNTIENNDYCGSPTSDITDPEVISQDNWPSRDLSLKPRKNGVYAESPSSDFECSSSCAEDSGISSTVRDDEMEEIPLADGALSPELFQEMSKLNVNDMVSSWVPKSNNTYSPSIGKSNSTSMQESQTLQNKRKVSDQNSVGWKLFGKVPPKESAKAQPLQRDDVNRSSFDNPASKKTRLPSLKKSNPSVKSSTTALIFENRPRNLPAKSATEEKKHRQQYEAMVANARKKELQEVKKQEKQIKQKNKQEKQIVNAASVWVSEILPNWETTKGSRKAKELWWQGLPPSIRGKVWKLAIGNDLQITYELFDIFQAHAFEKLIVTRNNKKRLKQSKSVAELPTNNFIPVVSSEHKVELIMLDVSRTFPLLCIFQEGGPFHDLLHSILGAYTCYRPDVGYVQGMSFIAAVLLLNMDPPDAFVCFANLLNKPCQLVFFRVDHPMMKAYFATFEILLEEFLPRIASLFVEENFSPDMYLIDWIFTLFSKSLPLDVACRVWDVFCRDGDDFLFCTALGILKHYQQDLMGMDFIHLGQFLTKLPDDVSANKLFDSIGSINLSRQKFNQILAQQKELATQIKTVTASAGK